MTNQLNDFYISTIAEESGLLESNVERLISAKVIQPCSNDFQNIAEVIQQAKIQAEFIKGKDYKFYSYKDIARVLNLDETNLNKTIGNHTLNIPNPFSEKNLTFYALTEHDLMNVQNDFKLAWSKTIDMEKVEETEHQFETPVTPKINESTDTEKSSQPIVDFDEGEESTQKKKQKSQKTKEDIEQRRENLLKQGLERDRQLLEERKRELYSEYKAYGWTDVEAKKMVQNAMRNEASFQAEIQSLQAERQSYKVDKIIADRRHKELLDAIKGTGENNYTNQSADYQNQNNNDYVNDYQNQNNAITYTNNQNSQSSFEPIESHNAFQIYRDDYRDHASSVVSSYDSVRMDSDTVKATKVEHITSDYQQLSSVSSYGENSSSNTYKPSESYSTSQRNDYTVTYEGSPVTNYHITGLGEQSVSFDSYEAMQESPYYSENAKISITTANGNEISLTPTESRELQELSHIDSAQKDSVSSYYIEQYTEREVYYQNVPVTSIECVNQDGPILVNQNDNMRQVLDDIRENNATDLNKEYYMHLANGETVSLNPRTLTKVTEEESITSAIQRGASKDEISTLLEKADEKYQKVVPDTTTSSNLFKEALDLQNNEEIVGLLTPNKIATMQDNTVFRSSATNGKGKTSVITFNELTDGENFAVSCTKDIDSKEYNELANSDKPTEQKKEEKKENDSLDLNVVRHRNRVNGNLASTMGNLALHQTVGLSGEMMALRKVARYTGMASPLVQLGAGSLQSRCQKGYLKAINQSGLLKANLQACGVNTTSLYKFDKYGNLKTRLSADGKTKVPVYKKSFSKKDIQSMMAGLNTSFMKGNLTSVPLTKLTDSELQKLIKVGGVNGKIAETYLTLKKMQGNKALSLQNVKRMSHSLKSILTNAIADADVYRGYCIVASYARLARFAVAKAKRTKRRMNKFLEKHVKPIRVYNARKRAKRNLRIQKRTRLKDNIKTSIKLSAENINKKAWKKATGRTKGEWKTHLTNKFNDSKVGRAVGKARKKLAPVKKVSNATSGILHKVGDKIFGAITEFFSFIGTVKKFLLGLLGAFAFIAIIVAVGAGLIIAGSADITEGSVVTKDGKSLLKTAQEQLMEKDNNWFINIQKTMKESTPEKITGKKQYTLKSPFTGKSYEIKSFDAVLTKDGKTRVNSQVKCYDACAWDYIFPGSEFSKSGKINKEKLKKMQEHEILPYSNTKSILAMISTYCMQLGIDTTKAKNHDTFLDLCNEAYNRSHCVAYTVSDKLQPCAGKDCQEQILDCRDIENEVFKKTEDISGKPYYDTLKKKVKDCDVTYYCNDPDSWKNIHFFGKNKISKPSGKGCKGSGKEEKFNATLYCEWSGKANLNPEPPASVPKGAKGSFEYTYKDKTSVNSKNIDDCKDSKLNSKSPYFDINLIKFGLNNDITLLKQGVKYVKRTVGANSYYLAYTPNLQAYTLINYQEKVKPQDGFFLIDTNHVNKKTGEIELDSLGNLCENNRLSWFYNCQGHEVTGYKISYCPGHTGCKGHKINFCLGHIALESYVCIAGMNECENKKICTENIATVDDKFFTKNKDKSYAPKIPWDYDSKWNGYSKGKLFELIQVKMQNAWEQNYGIKEDDFKLSKDALKLTD